MKEDGNFSYVVVALLEQYHIMELKTGLVKALPRNEMKVPSDFVNFQETVKITAFAFFVFDLLHKAFSFTLRWNE